MAHRYQQRSFDITDLVVEERHRGEAPVIAGHAAVFGQVADLGYMREEIAPGAFTRALKEGQEVTALWNHDPNFVLASTKNGSLRLSEDKIGLYAEITPLDTPTVRDMVVKPIQAGLVNKMSFGFIPQEETIRQDKMGPVRVVRDVDLFDVSPVTFPAYAGTDISARAAALHRLLARAADPNVSDTLQKMCELMDQLMEQMGMDPMSESASRAVESVQVSEPTAEDLAIAGAFVEDRYRHLALLEPFVKGTISVRT